MLGNVIKSERNDLLSILTVSSILKRWNKPLEMPMDSELTNIKTTRIRLSKWNSVENRITITVCGSCLR